jgi:hypothetical protein
MLFIHGGLNTRNIGYVPPHNSVLPYASVRSDDMIHCNGSVHEWIGTIASLTQTRSVPLVSSSHLLCYILI